ncbi:MULTISPECIES: phenylacetate--CoA ligase family protein [unclassified Adlercreutzia]|uniref:phenylacetate--CoA ligase family protein n=1 Tax=unclassified Adlercreutzia TaxID=2636013 RepID=UPI0013ED3E5C|nr:MULTISPECIES: phenylacetate--CoA ligase [unclassified Adlercreutzia]
MGEYFQPEIETMPREKLREQQLENLRWSVRHAYDNVDLYRQRFDDAGVSPDDIQTLEDIQKFPFVVKQDMRDAYPFGMFALENKDIARIHASSGTTGQATVVGHSRRDLDNWGNCFARGIAMVGGSEKSTIQVSYGYGLFTGGLGAHDGGEAMGCTVIPTSSGNTKRQVQMMRDCETDILACTPSYALLIADTAIEMGYNPATEFKISGGIFGAEPCSENMRQEISDKLGIQYCDVYGLSEIMGPGVAMECKERGGLHIAEDQFYCEIVDPDTGEVLPDGEWGELVITTLTRECSPMIRYRTRDVTRIISEPCACGRTHRKIDRLRGRTDDMLIIRGVNVFPSQIEQVITAFPEIATQYQIILTNKGPLDSIELQVETEPDFQIDEVRKLEDLKARLQAELKSNLQVNVNVKIVEPKTIERSMGKAKRVIDLRGQEA